MAMIDLTGKRIDSPLCFVSGGDSSVVLGPYILRLLRSATKRKHKVLLKSAAMGRLGRGLILLAAGLLALPASAHPVPFSYLDLQLQRSSIEVSLTVHIYDLAHDLQITPMERLLDAGFLAMQDTAIRALLTPRLQLTADGRPGIPEWLQPEILEDRQSVRFHLSYAVTAAPG